MISNSEIKLIKSLSIKKFRDEYGLFAVEGEKMVEEALASSFEVVKVFRTEDIGEAAMSRISAFKTPSPALAVVRKPEDAGFKVGKGLCLALDSIRDPGNLGTIIRIADWFGIKSVAVSAGTVDAFNPKTVQSTMGALFRVGIHCCDIVRACKDVLSAGGKVYGTFLDGKDIYSQELPCDGEKPSMIVIGNESEGISPAVESVVSEKLFIPPFPAGVRGSESLNAAVATGIAVAEFRRRERFRSV